MRKSLHLAASAAVLALGVSSVRATTISSTSTYTTVTSIGVGQTVGTDGWWLSRATPSSISDPAYVSTITQIGGSNGSAAADITVYTASNTTPVVTNYYYAGVESETYVTITLTGNVPGEFQLGILSDNETNGPYAASFTVTDLNPSDAASGIATDSGLVHDHDNFYLIDVTGAQSGDTLSVSGSFPTPASSLSVFGGLSFDTIPTPEPSALSLLGVGAVALLSRRRRACKLRSARMPA